MSEATLEERIQAAVSGLSAADGLTWTAWWHRMSQLPPRRAVRLGQARQHAVDMVTTSVPTPYLQSSSPELVDPAGPTDDTEWFVVAVRKHLGQRLDGSAADDRDVWQELATARAADSDTVRGRTGTVIALANMAAGQVPPASGNDNPHYFDDIALVRALAAGLLRPGAAGVAADLAEEEARVTHALDGVWGARAAAALVAELVVGRETSVAVEAARAELPEGSWCAHVVGECLGAVRPGDNALTLAARLERDVVDHVYAYANQAPETLGLLLAHLQVASGPESLLLGALSHPRHADALAPLAGAVAGAHYGGIVEPDNGLALGGVCVRGLRGVSLNSVVTDIVRAVDAHKVAP